MLQGNTHLYHDHILNNIECLQKRKNGYVSHRLQFIHDSCEPLLTRIASLKNEIKYYENLRDNQYSIIQANDQIMKLKKEISSYTQTNKYYDNRLDEFDRFIAQLEMHLQQRKRYFATRKQKYRVMLSQSGRSLKFMKPQRKQLKKKKSLLQSSILGSMGQQSNFNQQMASSIGNSKVNAEDYTSIDKSMMVDEQQTATKLPHIQRAQYSNREYGQKVKQKLIVRHNRNQIRLQKVIQQFKPYQSLNSSLLMQSMQDQQIQLNADSIKEIKRLVTQFDHTQALFRDCFERKKLLIQKSVSQLQPKLISNKDLFMQACEKIGQKQGSMPFEDFSLLSTDQVATLFVSFGWLNRKIYAEFAEKRKNLMKALKIIKHFQQIH